MEVVHPRCAGLDVHKDVIVACVRLVGPGGVQQEVRKFGATSAELLTLSEWLSDCRCSHVAMEATGVYWKPVWHVLEGNFELVLGNAAHIKNVPGRKTDVNDATWIADLLAHGLIRSSFVPPRPVQELRDLTRTRKQLVREVAQHTLRIQKTLEDANVKLSSVISDVLGQSGRAILDAIVAGESEPSALAARGSSRLKASKEVLADALQGRVRDHHRFMIRSHLRLIDTIREEVAGIDERIGEHLKSFRGAVELLTTIPGISDIAAHVILGEIGDDMSRFPTAGHLVSWAGLCPRNDESAGRRRSTRLRAGAPWLKTVLVQAAWAASRKKNSYFKAQFHRISMRRGPKKAVVAVAASMLTAAYHMLQRGVFYEDLGPDHFDRRDKDKVAKRLIRRLEELGLKVEVRAAS
jgi:transposase